MSSALTASDRAPGLHLAAGVTIPDDATIAPHVTVYAGVQIGPGVSIGQGAIVGRPQQVHSRSRSVRREAAELTTLGAGCFVGSTCVVGAGASLGEGTYLGDHCLVRETAATDSDVMVGRGSALSMFTRIGARTRLQDHTMVGPGTIIEEDVLVSPRVTFIGDPTMGRRSRDTPAGGIVVRRASRIGTSAIIFPPAEVGEESVIGAASLVRADVPPRTVVVGTPARHVRAVRDDELLERWRDAG